MSVEKIRYKDFLDYAERLTFSGVESKVARGEYLIDLVAQIDKSRSEKGTEKDLFLSKDEIDFIVDKGFITEPFWAFLKNGKAPEYGSPLTDYQHAYIEYMTNPMVEDRAENFEELKNMENVITALGNTQYLKHLPLTRGDVELSRISKGKDIFADIPYLKQAAYGKNGLRGQMNAVYEDLAKHHNPALVETLRQLESMVAQKDISTNDVQLYGTAEFVTGKDGKEELHYTINAPLLKTNSLNEVKVAENEAVTVRVTDKGIQGAKYTDFNLYYDDLSVMVKGDNGKMAEKTGKKAADYLKEHPNDDYPDPNQIQQIKVEEERDGKMTKAIKWVYVLPDMSYPEKGATEPFTKDFSGIHASVVSGRLKEISKEVERMSLEQAKVIDIKSWMPQKLHAEKDKETYREAIR